MCEAVRIAGTKRPRHSKLIEIASKDDVSLRITIGKRDSLGKRRSIELQDALGPVGQRNHRTLLRRAA